MTLPNKTYQANTRARKAAQGLVRVEVWVPEDQKTILKEVADAMRDPTEVYYTWRTLTGSLVYGTQPKDQSDE